MPTALVTGATEGIGRAITLTLGAEGYAVGVCARTPSTVTGLLDTLAEQGIAAAGTPADVGDPDQVHAFVAHVTERLGPIDLLVNNAGIGRIRPVEELTLEDWDVTMRTNLRSMYLVTREVLPAMRARRSGIIVNIASLAARVGFKGGTAYAASKHAVLGFSRSLMLEVRKEGVRVVCICPGSVDTPFFTEDVMLRPDRERILQAQDVADMVLATVRLPPRAVVGELDMRPADP